MLSALKLQAAAASDREICGALLGTDQTVHRIVPIRNQSPNPENRFLITARDVLRIERESEADGEIVLGFYHSHPQGDPVPSADDLSSAVPGYTHLILARTGAARAWRLREDRNGFDEVELIS